MAEEETATVEEQEAPAAEESAAEATEEPQAADSEQAEVYDAELPEAIEAVSKARGGQIDVLLDTSMPVEVSLGSVELEVRELLQISPGSVITLDKQAGEPLDLFLKGIRFATAELVLADDKLGVRIREILPRRKTDQTPAE
jgi:flagellar motor switch protein FliN/FliY